MIEALRIIDYVTSHGVVPVFRIKSSIDRQSEPKTLSITMN
jgi:hypothetical protein